MQTAAFKIAAEFINSVKNNDLPSFINLVADRKKDEIRSLIGYLGGAGIETTTSYDEFLLISIDMLNENLMEYLGDDCYETIQVSVINETETTATAVFSANGSKKSIQLMNEDNSWKVADFGDLEDR